MRPEQQEEKRQQTATAVTNLVKGALAATGYGLTYSHSRCASQLGNSDAEGPGAPKMYTKKARSRSNNKASILGRWDAR